MGKALNAIFAAAAVAVIAAAYVYISDRNEARSRAEAAKQDRDYLASEARLARCKVIVSAWDKGDRSPAYETYRVDLEGAVEMCRRVIEVSKAQ